VPGDLSTAGSRRLVLFGPMRAETEKRSSPVPRGASQRLLGFLALHPGTAHRREALTEILSPETGEASRRSVSDTLYRVRRQLGVGWVDADADSVALAPEVDVDVWEFDRLVTSADPADLAAAVNLYADELVPGIYDDWAQRHRVARHLALLAALARLVDEHERNGQLQPAVLHARRMIVSEPLDESAHQTYLRLLGRLHRYGEAIAHYESLAKLLHDELGVEPLPATVEIVDRLAAERDVATAAPAVERTRLVGRVAERAAALASVEAQVEGRGSVLCVEGVAGIGKSRLLAEVVAGARWRGATVTTSEVAEIPEASPLAPLARAVSPLLSAPVRMEIESRLDERTMVALAPLHPDWQTGGAAATSDELQRLHSGLRVVGEVLARSGNVVVALDDLHWASASLWGHLDALVDGFVPNGGLLVVAYRRPEVEATPGWSVLQGWDRRGVATVLALAPLEPADVAELIGSSAAEAVEVVAATGGVPFYIAQWMLEPEREGSRDPAMLARRRLDRLAPVHRKALQGGAVLGENLTFRAWLDVTGMSPLELAAASDELTAGRWLAPTPDGYVFIHDLLRVAVYEEISESDRMELHARAAAVLAVHDPGNWPARAFHLDRASVVDEAVDAYREAGRSLRADFAFIDALDAFGRALELLPRRPSRRRLELGVEFAEAYDIVGGRADGRDVLAEVITLARRFDAERSLLRGLLLAGGDAIGRRDHDAAERLLAEARSLAERLDDGSSLALAMFRQAELLTHRGEWSNGLELFFAARALADTEQDVWLRGRAICGAAGAAARMGRPAEAAAWLEEALAGYEAAGDRLNEMDAAAVLALTHYELGSWDALVATAERTLSLARSLGNVVVVGIASQALGLAALAVGDRATARAQLLEAERCWTAAGRPSMVGGAINCRGLIAQDDGAPDEAIALYTAAIDAARAADAATDEAYASHDLGALLLELGRPAEAIALLRTSVEHWSNAGNDLLRAKSEAYLGLAVLEAGGSGAEAVALADSGLGLFRSGDVLGEHPQAWLWGLSRLLTRLDRGADADDVLGAARRELLRQAATISDPARRRGFFERVPLNRAIMADVDSRSGTGRPTVVRLAHCDAPLGRTLRADELVDVRWTVHAAADDAIADAAVRRRHRLQRLLTEAAEQSAAPTDDDLATALGVSRRTILRDMEAIGSTARARTRRGSRQHGRHRPVP
jgi:DNA-binding SARP family transcriptional activator